MKKLKQFIKKFKSLFPSPLPSGMTEFESYATEILELAGAPHNDSTVHAVAVMIMHLGPLESSPPKNKIVRQIRKGMANEVAQQVFVNMQEKHRAKVKAEQEAAVASVQDEQKAET